MSKKIGIVGTRGLPANYGAFDTFVDQFVKDENILNSNIFFFISTINKNYTESGFPNVKQFYVPRLPGPLILFNYLITIMIMLTKGVRVFLFFGYGAAIFFPFLKLLNCKIICNPDGIEWRRPNNFIKKNFFKICEFIFAKIKISKIYDSEVIKRYYLMKYNSDGEKIYYPSKFENSIFIINRKNKIKRFYLTGRLLEENNIELIVNTFKRLVNYKLFIIGHKSKFFKKKILPLIKDTKNIFYIGEIYDKKKLLGYLSFFDYYIHGHKVGGTNPTLIEAINLKKKIFAYDCSFNKEILGKKNIYFKDGLELENLIKYYDNVEYGDNIYKKYFTKSFINKKYLKILLNEF
tara:strand:+ start:210 stop:1256 length:1047 start_codon:yes stop_codon:yes gene_type:complete